MTDQVAILLDGGFVKKRLKLRLKRFPGTADVVELSTTIMGHDRLKSASLFRVFFYDAPPYEGTSANPLEPRQANRLQIDPGSEAEQVPVGLARDPA